MKYKMSDVEIDEAKPHTIKKFELIEEYVKSWAQKLLNYSECTEIIFIDCMCNSGIYLNQKGQEVYGTPIRISNVLAEVMKQYLKKKARVYLNDFSNKKIDLLKTKLPSNAPNFEIITSCGDGNDLLKQIATELSNQSKYHYLLVYDPYKAELDWNAIEPFLNCWGEVIINHMLSDSIRGVSLARRDDVIERYEQTYLTDIRELISFGSDRKAFENKIEEIISLLKQNTYGEYYIAVFPFFNSKNALVYNLVFCTNNINGLKLFKKTAWKTFGGKSSMKDTQGDENQLFFNFEENTIAKKTDEYCYNVDDIVDYVQNRFWGQQNVALDDIWRFLDVHPVFPADGYKTEIKKGLKKVYGDVIGKKTISFTDRR